MASTKPTTFPVDGVDGQGLAATGHGLVRAGVGGVGQPTLDPPLRWLGVMPSKLDR